MRRADLPACGHDPPDPNCSVCRDWQTIPGYADNIIRLRKAVWAGQSQANGGGALLKPKRLVIPLRAPCRHEGPIVEFCTSCDPQQAEANHVRQCLHDAADWDTCRRSAGNPAWQSCALCPIYEP